MVRILFCNVDTRLPEEQFFQLASLLPEGLRKSAIRFRHWQDRQTSLFGKFLLICALQNMGVDADLSQMKYTANSRPFFNDTVDFNISHSGTSVICAISDQVKLGIDIEEPAEIDIRDFERQWCAQERQQIALAENTHAEFYRMWTRKEAVLKAAGVGLSVPLQHINVTDDVVCVDGEKWFLSAIAVSDATIAHLATSRMIPGEELLISVHTMDSLYRT
jgi:4'-phosphopantetheinyl transferase